VSPDTALPPERTPSPNAAEPSPAESSSRFINRELSWLAFNARVLEEAYNLRHPLLERLRFLAISADNLDEFYMVRVAGLKGQIRAGIKTLSDDGLTPEQQVAAIDAEATALMHRQQQCWLGLRSELSHNNIHVLEKDALDDNDRQWSVDYFMSQIFPVLTPIAFDPAHPFPFIPNKGFSLVALMRNPRSKEILRVMIPLPAQLERFIRLPGSAIRFILLENLIEMNLERLFPGFEAVQSSNFRIIRDSEMEIDEEAEDLVRTFESALKRRRRGTVIRLTVSGPLPGELREDVLDELGLVSGDELMLEGMLGLADLKQLIVAERRDLLFPPFNIRFPERVRDFEGDVMAAIRKKDIIIHHPYESFDVVVQFVSQAARDPAVVAIKQTLYRTSNDSPIVAALIEAAESGKSVTALIELKARFDEEANIRWARDMERAGVHVVYGVLGKKIHAKVNLVVRREGRQLRSYVHYGTGNYHPVTARLYTDLSFFTCDPAFCRDAARLFNYMTGYALPETMEKISFAPANMRATLVEHIEREIANAKAGKPSGIWAKMNSLVDAQMIDGLYRASQAGVPIDLVVRGICCLRPGVSGLSDNIRVKSIVGRFLEHGRIVCFANGEALPSPKAKVFISSADWMPRNLDRRVETLVPIENPTVHRQVLSEIMAHNIEDEAQSWNLGPDGQYTRHGAVSGFCAHDYFMNNPSLSGRGTGSKKEKPRRPLPMRMG
jgi:polyphosphate kinase